MHKCFEDRKKRRSIRHRKDDELHMSPFGGIDDNVAKSRYQLRLVGELELHVVYVQPNEDALDGSLEVVALEEYAQLNARSDVVER